MNIVPNIIVSFSLIFALETNLQWISADKVVCEAITSCEQRDVQETKLQVHSIQVSYNRIIALKFNYDLQTSYTPEQWTALRASITLSYDGGKTFRPLRASDQLQLTREDPSDYLSPRTLILTLADKFPEAGVIVKTAAESSIRGVNGNKLAEDYLTPLIVRGMSLKLESDNFSLTGEPITFIADRAGTVLLTQYLPADGALTEYKEKSIKVVTIDESSVGQLITIETDGIRPGNYRLMAWQGEEIPLGISVTPSIGEDQVIFEKSEAGNDKITITGVQPGDKLFIYNDSYKPSQGWIEELYSIIVPEGQTSVVVQQLELDASGKLVFLLERDGLLISQPSILEYEG